MFRMKCSIYADSQIEDTLKRVDEDLAAPIAVDWELAKPAFVKIDLTWMVLLAALLIS